MQLVPQQMYVCAAFLVQTLTIWVEAEHGSVAELQWPRCFVLPYLMLGHQWPCLDTHGYMTAGHKSLRALFVGPDVCEHLRTTSSISSITSACYVRSRGSQTWLTCAFSEVKRVSLPNSFRGLVNCCDTCRVGEAISPTSKAMRASNMYDLQHRNRDHLHVASQVLTSTRSDCAK